ncbi:MAG: DUF4245 family protein [Kineosporiaceae bacterium]
MSTTTDPQSPPPATGSGQQPPAPDGRTRRGVRGTVADMVRTMVVVLAVVAVIWLLVPRPNRIVQPQADVAGVAAAATQELGYTPLIPQDLPSTWVPTEAAVRDAADGIKDFHLGYTSPQGQTGVEQATRLTNRWLEINDAGGKTVGRVTIDGLVWVHLYKTERDYTSLLLRRPNQVILVTSKGGGLPLATQLVRALHVPAS